MGKSKAKRRVLIADDMSPLAQECFKQAGIEVDVKTGLDKQGLGAIIGGYDGLVVRSATKVTSKVLEAADNLRVIGRAGIGVDNIDVEAATAKGIVVMNTPFGNSITTAEHAISLMLAVARQIPQANASTHAGKWEKSRFMGVELMGKTLGIIGCGNIGSVVADRAQGLKMKVIAYDPFRTEERADDLGVEKVELAALFMRADFISLHTPLTDATRSIIDAKAIRKMKKSVHIINCARGGLIVEKDLKMALEKGDVAGAALAATVTGLANGTAYTFAARAGNAIGAGGLSVASGTVTPVGPTSESRSVVALPGDGQIRVSWAPPVSDGGAAIEGYVVTANPAGASRAVDGATFEAGLTELANDLDHTFTVVATNSVGAGPPSQPSVAVAPHGPTPIPSYSAWGLAALASIVGLIMAGQLGRSHRTHVEAATVLGSKGT